MLPKRLPLFLAFVGGSLSTAALVEVWRADGETSAPSPAPPLERMVDEPPRETVVAQPATEKTTANHDDASAESGTLLADVLARFEAAYRRELAAAEPVPSPVEVSARAITPPAPAPVAESAPEAPAPPPVVVAIAPPPANVHVGDVQQEVYNGDVQQGDVNQVQQVVLNQYVQLPAALNGQLARPATPRQRVQAPRKPPAHIAITDPNNPWGFDFPPTPLVK